MSTRPDSLRDDEPVRMPARIGRYRVQRVLGSGGMATVYAALQEQPRRTVALKVMRPGIVSRNTERRFRHEMEILAKLRHPYIAQIFDAGTHDDGGGGVPYFVMEYIPEAKPLTDYADAKQLDQRERLKLFVKVCAAVQHGHAARIVHRDLKPGNVLVDAKGDPKVIDFGVARVTEMDIGTQTQHTEAGRLVGTVAFMSPEQVAATGSDLGPTTDVYALGVTLFRLLCGRMPHSLVGLPLHEVSRVIREDAPIRPSSIKPELRGDLETIILTALEKDPTRRYRDAGELGRDLLRYLNDQPIKARPAGIVYRLRLFSRRHRTMVFAGAMMLLTISTLAAGGGWLWWQYRLINLQWQQIEVENRTQAQLRRESAETSVEPVREPPRQRVFMVGHRVAVAAIAVSADGQRAATLDRDGAVMVWEVPGGHRRQAFEADSRRTGGVAISADGALVAMGRDDGVVEVRSVVDGATVSTRRIHSERVLCVAIRDGWIASGSADITVRLWRLDDGPNTATTMLRGAEGPFSTLAFTTDGASLIAGTESGRVVHYDIDPPTRRTSRAVGRATVSATSIVGDVLAVGTGNGRLLVLSVDDGSPGGPPGGPGAAPRWSTVVDESPLTAVAVHPSGLVVAAAGSDGVVRLYDIDDGSPRVEWHSVRTGSEPGSSVAMAVASLAFTPDGRWLAVGARDGLITLLPVEADSGLLQSLEP